MVMLKHAKYKFKEGTDYLGLDKVLFYFMKIKNLDKINEYFKVYNCLVTT